jgi:hypothetical protein
MIVPSKVFLLLMIIISPVLIQSKEAWLRKQASVETPKRELATADVCSIKVSAENPFQQFTFNTTSIIFIVIFDPSFL